MKLFDLSRSEERTVRRLVIWHLGYLALIAGFFGVIYYFGFFKTNRLLREGPLFTYMAPVATAAFILVSPWRGHWRRAIRGAYERVGREPAFCIMATMVFFFGFYLYSVLLWGLGALAPSIFYM